MRAGLVKLMFIMALMIPPSFQSNEHYDHQKNVTRAHKLKNFYTQKFRSFSYIDFYKPPSHRKRLRRNKDDSTRQLKPELINLFKKSFMSLVGSEDLLITREKAGVVPEYIVHLYKQSQTKRVWRERNRRLSNGWFAGDTVRSFMPEVQKSNYSILL